MQALVVEDGRLRWEKQYPDPQPEQGEVVVAVELAGICSTDLEIVKGYMDFRGVPGHEFVGTVVKGPRALKDRRVVGEINCVCGKCDMCQSGLSSHCRQRTVVGIQGRDGVFAEYVKLPERNVHVLPDTVGDEEAVFVEPLAAALQIVKQVPLEKRDRVIVLGDGRLGLLAVQVLAQAGGKGQVVLLGKHTEKLTFCEKRGIQGIHLDELLIKPEWDVVVDCTGSADGFAAACRLVRPRGRLVLKSTFVAEEPIDLTPLVINEVMLIGSRCGPFPEAINALAADKVVVNGMITGKYSLKEGEEAFAAAAQTKHIKVVFDMHTQ